MPGIRVSIYTGIIGFCIDFDIKNPNQEIQLENTHNFIYSSYKFFRTFHKH